MHFSTLVLAFGACVLIGGPLPTPANPQLNPPGVTCLGGGPCNQGQLCCPGLVSCPKGRQCPPMLGEGAKGGIVTTCFQNRMCFNPDQCCKNAMPCPAKGVFCPSAF